MGVLIGMDGENLVLFLAFCIVVLAVKVFLIYKFMKNNK